MQAYRLVSARIAELRDVAVPERGPGEVLVKVGAAGPVIPICISCRRRRRRWRRLRCRSRSGTRTPGGSRRPGPGWRAGNTASRWRSSASSAAGAAAVPGGPAQRLYHRATRRDRAGTRRWDGAPYVSVPAEQLVPIGDLDVSQAAPLTDAGLTPYHAIRLARDHLGPGSACVVIGVGGPGHMTIQILAALTATRIIAVDVDEPRLQMARGVGAHEAVASDADAAAAIRARRPTSRRRRRGHRQRLGRPDPAARRPRWSRRAAGWCWSASAAAPCH
jgi:alcohol dehydrogenase, propanol-preferring